MKIKLWYDHRYSRPWPTVDCSIVIATFDISTDEIYINHLVDFVFLSWDFTRRKKIFVLWLWTLPRIFVAITGYSFIHWPHKAVGPCKAQVLLICDCKGRIKSMKLLLMLTKTCPRTKNNCTPVNRNTRVQADNFFSSFF